jgi:hypothetical protein
VELGEEGKEKRIAEHHNIEIHHCAGRCIESCLIMEVGGKG